MPGVRPARWDSVAATARPAAVASLFVMPDAEG